MKEIVIHRAKGVKVVDVRGNHYLDLRKSTSIWGHSHKSLTPQIKNLLSARWAFTGPSSLHARLFRKLNKYFPSGYSFYFSFSVEYLISKFKEELPVIDMAALLLENKPFPIKNNLILDYTNIPHNPLPSVCSSEFTGYLLPRWMSANFPHHIIVLNKKMPVSHLRLFPLIELDALFVGASLAAMNIFEQLEDDTSSLFCPDLSMEGVLQIGRLFRPLLPGLSHEETVALFLQKGVLIEPEFPGYCFLPFSIDPQVGKKIVKAVQKVYNNFTVLQNEDKNA